MKVAVIDMGTNTFHLLIARVKRDSHEILYKERKAVKIGEEGITQGKITDAAWNRALNALNGFKKTMDAEQVDRVFASATSAIRNASNGEALVNEIERQIGIEIDIISGTREAELIHLGASKALNLGMNKALIMDIGGGSIEFIIANQKQRFWLRSFEVGGQRLVERFHKSDPIAADEIQDLCQFLEEQLQPLAEACDQHHPSTLVGCSGTFDTLSDIYCAQRGIEKDPNATELPFDKEAFDEIYQDLITKTRNERLSIPGMIPMRVDMIVVAGVLIHFLLHRFSIETIRISAYALKEGILYQVLDSLQKELNTSK